MRRHPAFDPPEYVDWEPVPELVAAYRKRLTVDPARRAVVEETGADFRLALYRDLLRTRLHDVQLQRWVKTGVISKAWLGTGEEAVTVGAVAALDRSDDFVCPMIRNAGALHMMGMPLADMLRTYLATPDGPSGGRDLHAGDLRRGVVQPVSQMGSNAPVMAGVAMGLRARGSTGVALTWIGDGATKTGACHEGVNLAAVQNLPVVFVIQNNQVALGTTLDQHGAGHLELWPSMYGLPSWSCDGNNVLDVFGATALAAERCRAGRGPAVVVAETFRMGGHATHDEREARRTFDAELFEHWGRRDPIGLYEVYLMDSGVDRARLEEIEAGVIAEIDEAAEAALASRSLECDARDALYGGVSECESAAGLELRPV